MKFRLLILSLVLAGTFLSFSSCKKGENDPFLSLSSRKARLTGEWKLTNALWTIQSGSDIVTYSYDGTQMTQTYNNDSYNYAYSETLSILKDETFTSVVSEPDDWFETIMVTTTINGIWYFVDGNKNLDIKNAERVCFQATKETTSFDSDTEIHKYEGTSNNNVSLILLDELKNKEFIQKIDYEYTNDSGDLTVYSGTKTYTLK